MVKWIIFIDPARGNGIRRSPKSVRYQNEYKELFPNKKRYHCLELFKKYSYFAQTEFQQIIMWSDDESFDSLKKTNDINQLIEILSLKIQP